MPANTVGRNQNGPTTQWAVMEVSSPVLRGTHTAWARLMDGEHIFTVRPNGETPGDGDGGYRSLAAALKVKGLLS